MMKQINTQEFKEKIYNIDGENIHEFLGKRPAVVMFSAPWCSPCKAVSPILDELSIEYDDQIDFYKMNVDKEVEISSKLNIKSIPTFYFIAKVKAPIAITGAIKEQQFRDIINKF